MRKTLDNPDSIIVNNPVLLLNFRKRVHIRTHLLILRIRIKIVFNKISGWMQ